MLSVINNVKNKVLKILGVVLSSRMFDLKLDRNLKLDRSKSCVRMFLNKPSFLPSFALTVKLCVISKQNYLLIVSNRF